MQLKDAAEAGDVTRLSNRRPGFFCSDGQVITSIGRPRSGVPRLSEAFYIISHWTFIEADGGQLETPLSHDCLIPEMNTNGFFRLT